MKKDGSLNGKITYADMMDATERWFMNGTLSCDKYLEIKEALTLAFQMGCAEYLTRMTDLVCKKGRA